MEIREIKNKKEWEDFLLNCQEKTFLQSWNWGEFHISLGNKIWRFGILHEGKIIAVALVIKISAKRGSFLLVPHGPVIKSEINKIKFEVIKILKDKKPAAFFLENVKNLKSHDGGKTFNIISQALKDVGYYVKEKVLNSAEYGNVPQNRERVYIVGFKSEKMRDAFEFPEKIERTKNLADILEKKVDEKYYYAPTLPMYPKLAEVITKPNTVYQWRRAYVRENKSGVSPTLTANMGMGGHNVPLIKDSKGIRKLTPRECARLQGFPESYKLPKDFPDTKLYKQFGNSVSVSVVERVAGQIIKVLES